MQRLPISQSGSRSHWCLRMIRWSSSPQAGDLTSTHAVWSDQLERGILVGRDDRCSHGGLEEGNL